MKNEEIWKFIGVSKHKGLQFEKDSKLYVSNYGRCRADDKIIEPYVHKRLKYVYFNQKLLHRLVYELFVGEIPKGYEIDHIDNDRTNNRIDNLRIVTHKENLNNPLSVKKRKEQRHFDFSGEKNPRARAVYQIDMNSGEIMKIWSYIKLAADTLGITKQSICNCCRGRWKSAGGFVWRYV